MNVAVFPIYESYRNDVAPWLGDVPKDWSFEKAKWFLSHRKQFNSDGKVDNVLSLTLRGVVKNDPDNPEGLVPRDYRTYQIFEAGDLVFKLIDLENVRTSRVGLVYEQGIMSSAYIRLVVPQGWNARFLHYYYFHMYQAEVFNKIGSGVRSTLGQSDLLELPIPIVDRSTQDKIVHFLDEKCAKVNEAVRIKEDQITLLRERRQILIQHAVTRGLNPNAPMKDSGIDWIGQIPTHWEVVPLKRLFRERNDRSSTGAETLLSLRMNEGLVPHDDVSDKAIGADALKDYKQVFPGQLVMNRMRASIGIFGIVTSSGIVSPDYAIFDIAARANGDFFLQLFKTGVMGQQFRNASRGLGTGSSGFMRLYTDDFGAISVALPSPAEQAEIVLHVNGLSEKIGDAVRLKEEQIATLKEYKTGLINSAVTGKIKVA